MYQILLLNFTFLLYFYVIFTKQQNHMKIMNNHRRDIFSDELLGVRGGSIEYLVKIILVRRTPC
jgi:hypothetical protein